MDNDETLLVADMMDAFGGVTSRPSELFCEQLEMNERTKMDITGDQNLNQSKPT